MRHALIRAVVVAALLGGCRSDAESAHPPGDAGASSEAPPPSKTGRVVKTSVASSSGDAQVDEIVRASVATWRFSAIDGAPEVCSKIIQKVRFGR
jgi:hypothetical protein